MDGQLFLKAFPLSAQIVHLFYFRNNPKKEKFQNLPRKLQRNWCNLPLAPLIAPPAELKYGFSGRRETLQKEQYFLRQVPGTIHKLLGRIRIARIYANLSPFSTFKTIPQHQVHKITKTTSTNSKK